MILFYYIEYNNTDNYKFEFAANSDLGKVRSENQDRCGWFETSKKGSYIIAVADGMGGSAGGAIAAEIALDSVKKVFESPYKDPRKQILISFDLASKKMIDKADTDNTLHNMGCTLSLVLYFENQIYSGHVGDSRIYRFRGDVITQLSEDHSLVQEMVKQGAIKPENARSHPKNNILLRALTTSPDSKLDIYEPIQACADDVLLVCSDGLWNMIEDAEIQNIVNNNSAEEAVKLLIDRANELGGKDNISVSMMRIKNK